MAPHGSKDQKQKLSCPFISFNKCFILLLAGLWYISQRLLLSIRSQVRFPCRIFEVLAERGNARVTSFVCTLKNPKGSVLSRGQYIKQVHHQKALIIQRLTVANLCLRAKHHLALNPISSAPSRYALRHRTFQNDIAGAQRRFRIVLYTIRVARAV